MIMSVYAIFDSKVSVYNTPFYFRNSGEALRSFSEVCNDPKTMFNRHPEDYSLFELGTYDDSSATFILLPAPVSIGKALQYVKLPCNDKVAI